MGMIQSKSVQGIPRSFKQRIVHLFRMLDCQRVEFMRKGEHNMEVGNRKEFLLPGPNPLFPVGSLTFWAMPVSATVPTEKGFIAAVAQVLLSPQSRSSAVADSQQGSQLANGLGVRFDEFLAVTINQLCNLKTGPQRL